jgi:sec-independent protein translocase protein TatA
MTLPSVLALIGGLGTAEVLFILLIIMLLFGAAKIPELARSLGKAQREFQSARDDIEREISKKPADADKPAPTYKAHPGSPPSESAPADSQDAQVLTEAHKLGLETKGKSMAELRDEIAASKAAHSPKE